MFLHRVEIFEGLSSEVLEAIEHIAEEDSLPEGTVLFRAGDSAENLYILKDGQVALTTGGTSPITFPIDEPGGVFGWSSLVEPRLYTATAELTMDSSLYRLDGGKLLGLFEEHTADGLLVLRRLARIIASRLKASYERFGK
ncbi:Cyclic nucleotide-binding domain-containing protein [Desulfacinum hydrothermale DSM 13146]|uniref:Cyclic nucleotide-binding domain-containing protein n=1 Tax=Desulfacinum hydrothermale DSM 13146 TaxID=1121390 RepID=A0A1W1XNS7_9BACT|nr:cyclic nucleotide-binding domain-containing protein [Desulfacinum hydrothermale]SMC25629.1 Cyclic nucleotide-binding domain-containing protein [Desulfacinum hydrothermale DSM 13146]